jgi:drug/metabolite transporter (DMT)-like permease
MVSGFGRSRPTIATSPAATVFWSIEPSTFAHRSRPVSQSVAVRTSRLALGAALVTVVLWASAFVGIRAAAAELSAGSLALGRLTVGTIALGILVALRGWVRPSNRDLALIIASGLLWFGFYNVALNEAERNVDAGTAAMLVGMGPIFIAILAGLFLGEGLPARLLAGLAVAFVGVVVIGVATSAAPVPGANPTLGVVLCIASAIAYAIGVTLQKPAVSNVAPHQLVWISCAVGAVACLPFAPVLVAELSTASPSTIGWMVYLGLFPTSIAFTTWAYALRHTPAGRLGATTYLVPPLVILMGWRLLGEVPPPAVIAGGALCIGGVLVSRSTRMRFRFGARAVPEGGRLAD